MGRYIVQRLLAMIPVFMIVAITVFFLVHLTPGDPALIMAGDEATPSDIDALREELGLNRSIPVQLIEYFKDIVRGDLGKSIFSRHDVRELVQAKSLICVDLPFNGSRDRSVRIADLQDEQTRVGERFVNNIQGVAPGSPRRRMGQNAISSSP